MKKVYIASGCFWGVQHFFKQVKGIVEANSGYAQSNIKNPSYRDLIKGRSSAVEAVEVIYDEREITLTKILQLFFRIVDPFSLNRQGYDIGIQYRSGIYVLSEDELAFVQDFFLQKENEFQKEIVVEAQMLENFTLAENYHQDYLLHNPSAPCHINFSVLESEDIKDEFQ